MFAIVAFFALQLFLAWWSQQREQLREPDFGRQERYLQGQLAGDRPHLVLALGSSRTLTGFRGETVSDDLSEAWSRKVLAFNFGRPAFGPVMELVYLRRLLKDGVRPDLLLVEVLPALLARRNTGVVEERLRRSEVQALLEDGYLDEDAPARWWRENLSPRWENREALVAEILPQWARWPNRLFINRWGWFPLIDANDSPERRARAIEVARNDYLPTLTDFAFCRPTLDALRRIMNLAKGESIPVMLVVMPEGPRFRSWYAPGLAERVDSFLASLGVPVIDAQTWMKEDDFVDSHHLLPAGATRFSHLLSKELDRLAAPPSR